MLTCSWGNITGNKLSSVQYNYPVLIILSFFPSGLLIVTCSVCIDGGSVGSLSVLKLVVSLTYLPYNDVLDPAISCWRDPSVS
ncbi:Glutamyl-tRNA(Gln) amidotransferase subunit A [Fusarium oxysporum f. sp. albedinis]|nr:Glutamyl-tRNA(Gln) amidotransferase subunit A [Fusarium oxysporum f. sp. albedinis]